MDQFLDARLLRSWTGYSSWTGMTYSASKVGIRGRIFDLFKGGNFCYG